MKYEQVKENYSTGTIKYHHYVNENHNAIGECRVYRPNGQLWCHYFRCNNLDYGEMKIISDTGTLSEHYLFNGSGNRVAIVIQSGKSVHHTEEQLIQIAKERGLPLLSALPKTEEEVTLWNMKYPDFPCLPIEST